MSENRYWLMKSEPDAYSIDDLQRDKVEPWDGIRNYEARNFMRDKMDIGDTVLFYHSNATPPGIVGLGTVCSEPYPDFTAWDPSSNYFDAKTDPENPRWMMVDVSFKEKFNRMISLDELKTNSDLDGLLVIKRGMRLSIQPVEQHHFDAILSMI